MDTEYRAIKFRAIGDHFEIDWEGWTGQLGEAAIRGNGAVYKQLHKLATHQEVEGTCEERG